MRKYFHRYISYPVVLILVFSGIINFHSIFSFHEISNSNPTQLQKIDKNHNEFSFAVFGDNKNSVKTFNNLISKLNKDNTLFAIDVGDLAYDGEKEKLSFFVNQTRKLNKPLLTVVGNHEIIEEGRANYHVLFGKSYYSFSVGNSYFIILDDSNGENLDAQQLDWLKNELKKAQDYKNRFIFMHIPLYDPRKGNYKKGYSLKDLNFITQLNKLFDDNNVTMLFVSHIHGYYQGIWGKTPFIITGGGGARLAGSDPNHYFYHYIKVDVDNSNANYEVVKLISPDFDLLDRLIHGVWIFIYAFFVIHFIDILLLVTIIYLCIYLVHIKWDWIIERRAKKDKSR